MSSEPDMTEDELRRALSVLDTEELSVPEGFADRLWVDIGGDSVGSVAAADPGQTATTEPPDTPVLHVVPDVAALPEPDEPNPGWRQGRWAAAAVAGLLVVAGAAAWVAGTRNSPTDIAAEGGREEAVVDSVESRSTEADPDSLAELDFGAPVQISEVGVSTARVTFRSTAPTAYNVSLRTNGRVVSTSSGTTGAGEELNIVLDALLPSTTYEVDVTLIGPPTQQSGLLQFRTLADPDDPASFTEPIEIVDVAPGVGSELGRLTIETNVCSQASFAVLGETDRAELARVSPEGDCSTSHQFDLADVAERLGSGTSFLVIVEVQQVVDGEPNGNVTARTMTLERR